MATKKILTHLDLKGDLSVTGDLTVNGKVTQAGVIDREEWGRTYAASITTIATLLTSDGSALPAGGGYRMTGHIAGTGTDQVSVAVFWNENGTWYCNNTFAGGTSSNHIEFLISGGVPKIKTWHSNNYNINVTHERLSLDEDTGTDNLRGYFGADSFLKWTESTNALVVPGTVGATNLSGTNTGDQDLSAYATTSVSDGKYLLNTTDTLTGDLTVTGNLTVDGSSVGLYHKSVEDKVYFDDYNGSKFLHAVFNKNQRADIIRYQPVDNLEYWDGSSWQDGSSQMPYLKNLLDGRQDTSWYLPSTYYKIRFTATASTSYPLRAHIGLQMSWTGSSFPGCSMQVEEKQTDDSWLEKVDAQFTSTNGVTNWGTMFRADSALHTGRGATGQGTRITIDFYGWTPSNSSYATVPLQNIFIFSNFSGTENTDYTNLIDYNKNLTVAGNIVLGTGKTVDGVDISALPTSFAPTNAEQNVQANWTATSGDALILNKPTIPSGNSILDWTADQGATNIHANNYTNTNTQLSTEAVQDIIGGMVAGNTETNIAVTYDDASGKLNFVSTDTNTDTNTTYTAGNGLSLSGTEFRMAGGSIGGSVNLNTYTSSGYYVQGSNANASSGTNWPTNNAGILTVVRAEGNTTHITQTYDQYNSNAFYNRSYYGGTWSSWRNLAQDTNTQNTYTSSDFTHNDLSGVNANQHLDWTTDRGATNIHANNYTNTNTQLSTEQVQDIVGAMVSGNTENNITVTYQDGDGTLDFSSVDTNTNTQRTDEQIRDVASAQWINGTNTTVVKDDSANTIKINSVDNNTQLTEAQITAMGFIQTQSDTQDLSISGHTISLTNGGSVTVPDNNTFRGIHDTPVNGATTTSISSNWAFDHAASSTAHPRDTRSQIAGSYLTASSTQSKYLRSDADDVTNSNLGLNQDKKITFDSNGDSFNYIRTISATDGDRPAGVMVYGSVGGHHFIDGEDGAYDNVFASAFKVDGGTSSQFLKANGTVDSNTYLTSSSTQSKYLRSDTADSSTGTISAPKFYVGAVSSASQWAFQGRNNANTADSGLYFAAGHGNIFLRSSSNVFTTRINSSGDSYFNGGDVGIGTETPSSGISSQRILKIQSTGNSEVNVDHTDGGAGSDIGLFSFSRNGDHLAHMKASHDGATNSAFMSFHAQPAGGSFSNAASNERMRITSIGRVGIGTTNPNQKLDIIGGTNAGLRISATDTTQNWRDISIRSYTSEAQADALPAGVHLLTTNPSGATGNAFSKYGGFVIQCREDGNSSFAIRVGASSAEAFFINHNAAATFISTVTASNFILSSDKRLKENIKKVDNKHIDVNWKTFEMKSDEGQSRYGVIAQELEEVHPEFVRTDDKGMKSVAYIDLLIAKIAELEARLDKANI